VPIGQPCNNCLPPDTHAQIRRINLDGSGAEVIAKGVRNTVGFDWHPVSKELYFTDNGRDWASEDVPEDELNRVTKVGQHFGSPFCYQGDFTDPEFGWGRSCSEFEPPVLKTGPHSAGLGMRFYTGGNFPAKYKNAIFIARHGSWNRTKKFGGDILAVFLNKDGTVKGTGSVHLRLPRGRQQLHRPPGRCAVRQGRLDADLGRLQRRDLACDLRQPEKRIREVGLRTRAAQSRPPFFSQSLRNKSCGQFSPPPWHAQSRRTRTR
jgi:glucose/arabinose dehydrogenase